MKRLLSLAVMVLGVIGAYFVISSRMSGKAVGPPPPPPQNREEANLDLLHEILRNGTEITSCRNLRQQLNDYLGDHRDEPLRTLPKEVVDLLKNQFELDDHEMAEVQSATFTPLDAYYLDSSFLLHDGLQALQVNGLPPLQQATMAFDWVMRQAALLDTGSDALPPGFVLRRGYGSGIERALIYLSVLDQLGIDGCMLAVPGEGPNAPRLRYWAAGVLVDGDVYVFDPTWGLAIPGPKGKGIATLTQIRDDPSLIAALTIDPKLPYHVKPGEAKRAEIHVACSLSSLAARMRLLQDLIGFSDKLVLNVDPLTRWNNFKKVVGNGQLHAWNLPGDPNTPIRVLRSFVPTDEGGTDTQNRRLAATMALVPRQSFPPLLTKELDGEARARLLDSFTRPFMYFGSETRMPKEEMMRWLPGLVQAGARPDEQPRISEVIQRERMPRDLVVRGRFDEASNVLVELQRELDRQLKLKSQPEIEEMAHEWARKATQIQAQMLQMEHEAANPKPGIAGDLSQVRQARDRLWKEEAMPVHAYLLSCSAEPLLGQVLYQEALCKHEQALRAQARLDKAGKSAADSDIQATKRRWETAANWWRTYLDGQVPATHPVDARRWRAEALIALGQSAPARALLADISGTSSDQAKVANLYLAKQLR
jgi:hypothetical protein